MKIIFFYLFFLFSSDVLAEEISGFPRVIDGDTIHILKYKIRLEGIDAPEIRQQCKKKNFRYNGFYFL